MRQFRDARVSRSLLVAGVVLVGLSVVRLATGIRAPWESSRLLVSVISLPSHVNGAIDISGPNGYRHHVTSTSLLDGLAAGTYTANLSPVIVGTDAYYGAQSQPTAKVVAGQLGHLTADYYVIIASTTKLVPSRDLSGANIAPDQRTLTFVARDQFVSSLSPGDVIVAGRTPSTPQGLLRRVVSIAPPGGPVLVETENALIMDAVRRGRFSMTADPAKFSTLFRAETAINFAGPNTAPAGAFSFKNDKKFGFNYKLGPISKTAKVPSDQASTADQPVDDKIGKVDSVASTKKPFETGNVEGACQPGDVKPSGSFSMNPVWRFDVSWDDYGNKNVRIHEEFGVEERSDLILTVQGGINCKIAWTALHLIYGPADLQIGWLPVVYQLDFTFDVGAKASIVKDDFSVGIQMPGKIVRKLDYADGKVTQMTETSLNPKLDRPDFSPLLDSNLQVSAALETGPKLALTLYGVIGPSFAATAYAEYGAPDDTHKVAGLAPTWGLYAGVKGELALNAGLKLGPVDLGSAKLVSKTFKWYETRLFPKIQQFDDGQKATGTPGATADTVGLDLVGCRGTIVTQDSKGNVESSVRAPSSLAASRDHPLLTDLHGSVAYDAGTNAELGAYKYQVQLFDTPVMFGSDSNSSAFTHISGDDPVSDYVSKIGTGEYLVAFRLDGQQASCSGKVWVKVLGDPVGTPLWLVGVGLMAVGIGGLTIGVARRAI